MSSDHQSSQHAQELLDAYFQKMFLCWAENHDLPRKLLAKVDERKLPSVCTAKGVIDADFLNVLNKIASKGDKYKVALDTGAVQFHELGGVKVSVFKVDFHRDSALHEITNGAPNIHIGIAATETYGFERSVYGFWLHDFNDDDFEMHCDGDKLEQVATNLKGYVTQKLFFDGEAKRRWNAAAEHERYAAIGTWAAEKDLS